MTGRLCLLLFLLSTVLPPALPLLHPTAGAAFADDDGGNDDGGDDGGDDDGGDDDGGDDTDDGPSAAAPGERDTDNRAPGFLDFLFGPDTHIPREIVGWNLSRSERTLLEREGFLLLSDTTLAALGGRISRFAPPPGNDAEQGLARAAALLPDAALDLNHLYTPEGAVCEGPECWGARMIGLTGPAPRECRRRGPIAMIDGLPQADHPALQGTKLDLRSFLRPGDTPAATDHATAIAVLIGGRVSPEKAARPLVPDVHLLAAGVFAERDGRVTADAASILAALDWSISKGARVVALSLAGPHNRALEPGVTAAAEKAALVAAAGNGGPRAPAAFPAAYPGVTAVSAVDETARPYRQGTRGDYIDIAAPGVAIPSAAPDGGLRTWTGTSFAVPFVAVALSRAMVATRNDPAGAAETLRSLARDLGPAGPDPVYGAGLLRMPACR